MTRLGNCGRMAAMRAKTPPSNTSDAAPADSVSIYCISFSDGARYIGRTKQSLKRRLSSHRREVSNPELTRRLNEGYEHCAWIIRKVPESQAHEIEAKEIALLEKPINHVHATAAPIAKGKVHIAKRWQTGKRRYPRNDSRNYRCRVCRKWKPGPEFHSSSHRSCGVASGCKICALRIDKRMHNAHKNGITTSEAYYAEIAAIRRERGIE